MKTLIQRTCPVCNTLYNADPTRIKHGRNITCSKECSYTYRADNKKIAKKFICSVCEKDFYRPPSQIKSKHNINCCSAECSYKVRKRIVTKPYILVSNYDRTAAMKLAWETRRANPKPYPESARINARENITKNIKNIGKVSKFEKNVANKLKKLGFNIATSCIGRKDNGTFGVVYDIVIPERKIILECHGNYWHGGRWSWETPNDIQLKNIKYEENKTDYAKKLGYDLRIIWELDFRKDPIGAILSAVR